MKYLTDEKTSRLLLQLTRSGCYHVVLFVVTFVVSFKVFSHTSFWFYTFEGGSGRRIFLPLRVTDMVTLMDPRWNLHPQTERHEGYFRSFGTFLTDKFEGCLQMCRLFCYSACIKSINITQEMNMLQNGWKLVEIECLQFCPSPKSRNAFIKETSSRAVT